MNPLPSLRPKLRDGLPFVYLNVATTADGKLAPANRHFVPFTSRRDQEMLMLLRTRCDAVMAGARTVDLAPVILGPGGKKYREMRVKNGLSECNIRVIVSGSGALSPEAQIFKHNVSPLIVLVTEHAGKTRIQRLRKLGAIVEICGERALDLTYALKWLRKQWNVTRLLCEGGGEIIGALFEQDLVNQIYVTLSPTVFGGRHAPTLADGLGIDTLEQATKLKLKAAERVGDEMYLVYSVTRHLTRRLNQ